MDFIVSRSHTLSSIRAQVGTVLTSQSITSVSAHLGSNILDGPGLSALETVQKDPSILATNQALVNNKFKTAPWLLPPRSKVFEYSDINSIDEMLELRSKTILNRTKCISLLLFDKSFAVMTQNACKFNFIPSVC